MHTLLIVDDEEIEREGMAQLIPWDSYEMNVVGTARNGAEGLDKIAEYRPDLAIVDIKMPGMNGIEMIRQAKEQYPDMTFVVLSGYGDYEFTSQAMELGIRHYVLKPCDEAKMIPVLNKAIEELEEARAERSLGKAEDGSPASEALRTGADVPRSAAGANHRHRRSPAIGGQAGR